MPDNPIANSPGPSPATERTSVLLRRILAEIPGGEVSIGHIVVRLRRRSFGGLFLFLALLGLLPGISLFAGIAMLAPAIQMVIGFRAPILPRFIRRRHIASSVVRSFGDKVTGWVEILERYSGPDSLTAAGPVIGCRPRGAELEIADACTI